MEFMSDLGSNVDIYRPSLFELIAQEKMRNMLQPAVKYILSVYAQRYPRYLLRLVIRHDEFYALVIFFVERHYLKEWGASFAENFYGLKRVRSLHSPGNLTETKVNADVERLKRIDVWRSLLVLVGIPYVKTKLDNLYERLSGGAGSRLLGNAFTRDDQSSTSTRQLSHYRRTRHIIRNIFRNVYPWINSLYHISILAYNVGYLFDKTRYYTPWLHLMGIEVRRMSAQDYRDHFHPKTRLEAENHILYNILSRGFDFLKILLPMSIFFLKFLEWWYSSEYTRKPGGDSGIEIPPPEKLMPDPHGIPLPNTPNTCPLCTNHLTNPTAIPSGYVFCYLCVYRYVEDYGRCPVTWIKVDATQLRKVYNAIS